MNVKKTDSGRPIAGETSPDVLTAPQSKGTEANHQNIAD